MSIEGKSATFTWGQDPGGDLGKWWGMVARQDPAIQSIQAHRKECRENQVRNIARRKSDLAELRELRTVLAEQMKVVRAARTRRTRTMLVPLLPPLTLVAMCLCCSRLRRNFHRTTSLRALESRATTRTARIRRACASA